MKVASKYAEAIKRYKKHPQRAIEAVRRAEKRVNAEDERHGLENEVQKLTDSHISRVDDMLAQKEKDIPSV